MEEWPIGPFSHHHVVYGRKRKVTELDDWGKRRDRTLRTCQWSIAAFQLKGEGELRLRAAEMSNNGLEDKFPDDDDGNDDGEGGAEKGERGAGWWWGGKAMGAWGSRRIAVGDEEGAKFELEEWEVGVFTS
jgi:hypothetical protein